MPLAGGVPAPTITPLRLNVLGKPSNIIDTGTFIELGKEGPDCLIYFTTNGEAPNPCRRTFAGREVTYRYQAPFQLRSGRRTVKAIAVHRVTKAESHVVSKTFTVVELANSGSSESNSGDEYPKSIVPAHSDVHSSVDDSLDSFLKKNTDQGFAATNHSGTQINVYGSIPGVGWDMKTPDGNNFSSNFLPPLQAPQMYVPPLMPSEPGVTHQQLTAVVGHLTQYIDQMRQRTVMEVRESLTQAIGHILKAIPRPQPPPQPLQQPAVEFPLLMGPLSQVFQQFNSYVTNNSNIANELANADVGKVIGGDLDDANDRYVLKIELEKKGRKLQARPGAVSSKLKSERRDPKVNVPEGYEVETEVLQARNQKAAAIELKKEERPPHKVENAYFETEEYKSEGTLKPVLNFDCDGDCQRLRRAMKGLGTDEKAIIDVLARRSISQRLDIVKQFKTLYGLDLINELGSEISGKFFKVCRALCLQPEVYDAEQLREAVEGIGTDEDCLIEIICCRTNAQIAKIREAYERVFGRDLEKDIRSDTSGHFQRLMVSLLQGNRNESPAFDRTKAKKDAEELLAAGEKRTGTDESKFNEILISRSNAHLRVVFEEYAKMSKKTVEDALKSEMSGDLLRAFLSVVRCIQNKPAFFAKILHRSMKGMGTDDDSLIRVIVTRCEIDMVQIKDAFKAEYEETLGDFIKDDTSGDYRLALLTLIGEESLVKR
ncbi:Annexin A7 [Taenia crassiceps]|uniref:Annexin n=1 Tax=Taenia crassiceps TaxID=6207 RepID=A0ABR4QR22_9CEST